MRRSCGDIVGGREPFTGSYTACGIDEQHITVIPAFYLVVAHKNADIDQTPARSVLMLEYQTTLQMLVAARCEGACRRYQG